MIENIKAVAFDIDGTMYPNWRLNIRIVFYVLKHIKFFLKYRKIRSVLHRTAPVGNFYDYQARLFALELHVTDEEARQQINTIVYSGLTPFLKKVKPYAYIKETIEALKARGLKVAVLSDFPPSQKADMWGTSDLFDLICGSEEFGALKPSKYTFCCFAQKLGVAKKEILYVGNNVFADIRGAKAAGMKTAYIMPWWRRLLGRPLKLADISFKNYRQLKEIVLD